MCILCLENSKVTGMLKSGDSKFVLADGAHENPAGNLLGLGMMLWSFLCSFSV